MPGRFQCGSGHRRFSGATLSVCASLPGRPAIAHGAVQPQRLPASPFALSPAVRSEKRGRVCIPPWLPSAPTTMPKPIPAPARRASSGGRPTDRRPARRAIPPRFPKREQRARPRQDGVQSLDIMHRAGHEAQRIQRRGQGRHSLGRVASRCGLVAAKAVIGGGNAGGPSRVRAHGYGRDARDYSNGRS